MNAQNGSKLARPAVNLALVVLGGLATLMICLAAVFSLRPPWQSIKQRVRQAGWSAGPNGSYRVSAGRERIFGFDGLGNRVLVPDAAPFHFGTNQDFSVEAWIKAYPVMSRLAQQLRTWSLAHPAISKLTPPRLTAWIMARSADNDFGVTPVIDKHQTPSPFESIGFQLYLDSGRLACQLSEAPLRSLGFENFVSPGPDLRDGRWHHVAMSVVRNSAVGGTLYVDGKLVLVFDPTRQNGDLSNFVPLRIGNHSNPNLRCRFKGMIGGVALYRRALSAQDIAADAHAGR